MRMDGSTRSKSADDCLAFLRYEDLPSDEWALWQYLADQASTYPVPFIPPLKAPKGKPYVRRIIGAYIGRSRDSRGDVVPEEVCIYGQDISRRFHVEGGRIGARAFAGACLVKPYRSAYFIFRDGGKVELRLIAQRWASTWIEDGYTVDVLMGGGALKALIVKRGRHRWYLIDWQAYAGRSANELRSYAPRTRYQTDWASYSGRIAYDAATAVQSLCLNWFSQGASMTITGTGLRAASRFLPTATAKFRPLPMLVAMARSGGGYRGGMVSGTRYRGPAWLVDLNRAYTAALRYELPAKAVLDRCERGGVERHGMYVCRVFGRPGLPRLYAGRWDGREVDVSWHNDPGSEGFLTVLPSVEIEGIRAAGYHVFPSWGMRYVRTFTLAPFVDRIVQVCQHYGWDSPQAKLTKMMGNGVYGKLAASPTRRDLRISRERPDRSWYVFVDESGVPVEDLWERQKTAYQWSQHIDVASDITARVRGWMYEAAADVEGHGGQVAAMSTDALVLSLNPEGVLDVDGTRVGAWKIAGSDGDAVVAGPNAYSVGRKTIVPDHPKPTRDDVVSLFVTSQTVADAERNGAPFPGAPLSWKVRRTITMPDASV